MTAGRRKGSPKTGGRTAGTPNKKTAAVIKAVEDSGITPLEYMLKTLRNEDKPENIRLQAAKDAAPYVHQRLSSIEVTPSTEKRVVSDKTMSVDEWEKEYCPSDEEDSHEVTH